MKSSPTVKRVVRGYGPSLRQQLHAAGRTQQWLANQAQLSRQTIARAINADEVSESTAAAISAALGQVVDPVGRRVLTTPPPRRLRQSTRVREIVPGRLGGRSAPSHCVTATDLVEWADRLDSRAVLPDLVRRLAWVSLEHPTRVSFRAGEGIQLPDWDGIIVTPEGNLCVPEGTSAWELSTKRPPEPKASADYEKRTRDPGEITPGSTTFVFLTLRRWPAKGKWAERCRRQGRWRDVVVLDADDLEAWLTNVPSVHHWLSVKLGKVSAGLESLNAAMEKWLSATRIPLTQSFVLAGREATVTEIHRWFDKPSEPLLVRCESRGEAMAIVGAVLGRLDSPANEAALARAVVVHDAASLRQLATGPQLIVLPMFDAPEEIAAAATVGHRVIVPMDQGSVSCAGAVNVPPINGTVATEILVQSRIPREQAISLAREARRSLTALRRQLGCGTSPSWARPENGRLALPALLAGAWDSQVAGDREVLAALAHAQYEVVEDRLTQWAVDSDPMLRRCGEFWYVTSRMDAWSQLNRFLNPEDLKRFVTIALGVLGAPDPKYSLPADQRWMAPTHGHNAQYSEVLRNSMAEIVALMGSWQGESGAVGPRLMETASQIVKTLLTQANADWKLWASLEGQLPELAEAAPDAFLEAVDAATCGESPVVINLFTDKGEHLFASSPHTGMLWALERLAWSKEHVALVAQLLAKLARLDPGGRLRNRPVESLKAIFRPWIPRTSATLDERLQVLTAIRRCEPAVAWEIMVSMLPRHHDVGSPFVPPRWWDWAPDCDRFAPATERAEAVRRIVPWLVDDAGHDGARWNTLLEALPLLSPSEYELVLARLEALDLSELPVKCRTAIWEQIRQLLEEWGPRRETGPVEASPRVLSLSELLRRFEPEDPISRFCWLFTHRARMRHDEEELKTLRLAAIATILQVSGCDGILGLAQRAEVPAIVGWFAGESPALEGNESDILDAHLDRTESSLAQFAGHFAMARRNRMGDEWITKKLKGSARTWSAAKKALLLDLLDPCPDVWQLVAASGAAVDKEYWTHLWPCRVRDEHAALAANKFIAVGRPKKAVDLLASASRSTSIDPSLVVQVLRGARDSDEDKDPTYDSLPYEVTQLLDLLQRDPRADQRHAAELEWAYLPLVGRHEREPGALHRLLAENPAFFVQVVSCVYRAEGEKRGEIGADGQQRAERGDALLHSWRRVPGTMGDSTVVDGAVLRQWINGARAALRSVRRAAIGDHLIGQMLSGSPADSEGTWPCRAVRDILEEVASADIEKGLIIGVYNGLGVTYRNPGEGGTIERAQSEKYAGLAAAVSNEWPRTATLLRKIAAGYRSSAERTDIRRDLAEDLDR